MKGSLGTLRVFNLLEKVDRCFEEFQACPTLSHQNMESDRICKDSSLRTPTADSLDRTAGNLDRTSHDEGLDMFV